MTHSEMTKLFATMLLAYPNAEIFKGGITKLGPTIHLWTASLADIDFWTGQQAVALLVSECKFPPTIAEFRQRADQVKLHLKKEIDQAWETLRLYMLMDENCPQDTYRRLPSGCKLRLAVDTMGGPDKLIVNAQYPCGEVHSQYNYSGFVSAYAQMLRQAPAIGAPAAQEIGQGQKWIEGRKSK